MFVASSFHIFTKQGARGAPHHQHFCSHGLGGVTPGFCFMTLFALFCFFWPFSSVFADKHLVSACIVFGFSDLPDMAMTMAAMVGVAPTLLCSDSCCCLISPILLLCPRGNLQLCQHGGAQYCQAQVHALGYICNEQLTVFCVDFRLRGMAKLWATNEMSRMLFFNQSRHWR